MEHYEKHTEMDNRMGLKISKILDSYLPANDIGTEREKLRMNLHNELSALFSSELSMMLTTISLPNFIPPSTAIVSNNLKSIFDRCSIIIDKPGFDLFGFNVLVNDVFPFEDLDGNVVNGVIKDGSGKLTYIKQVK